MNPASEIPTATVSAVNDGVWGEGLEYVPNTRQPRMVQFAITEATNALPPLSGKSDFTVLQPINYITIAPSALNNEVHISLGRDVDMLQLPLGSGTWQPLGEYVARAGQGSVTYRIPTMRNYRFSVALKPPAGYALTNGVYSDAAIVVFGYLPDETTRVLVND